MAEKKLMGIILLVTGIFIAGFVIFTFLANPQSFSSTATSNVILLVIAIILILFGAYAIQSDDF
jgi:hypothetical protein